MSLSENKHQTYKTELVIKQAQVLRGTAGSGWNAFQAGLTLQQQGLTDQKSLAAKRCSLAAKRCSFMQICHLF